MHGWCVVRVCVGGNGCFVGLIVSCDEGRVICTSISSNSHLLSVSFPTISQHANFKSRRKPWSYPIQLAFVVLICYRSVDTACLKVNIAPKPCQLQNLLARL